MSGEIEHDPYYYPPPYNSAVVPPIKFKQKSDEKLAPKAAAVQQSTASKPKTAPKPEPPSTGNTSTEIWLGICLLLLIVILTLMLGGICWKYHFHPETEPEGGWQEFPKPTMSSSEIAQSHGCPRTSSIKDIINCYTPDFQPHVAVLYYLGTFCPLTLDQLNAFRAAKNQLLLGETERGQKYDAVIGVLDFLGDSPDSESLRSLVNSLGVNWCDCKWLANDRKRELLLALALQDAAPPPRMMPWIVAVERQPGSVGEYLREITTQLDAVKRGEQDVKLFRFNEADNIHHFQKWKWVFGDKGCEVSNSFVTVGNLNTTQLVKDAVAEYKEELKLRGCSIKEFYDNFIIVDAVEGNIAVSRDKVNEACAARDHEGLKPYLHPSVFGTMSAWMAAREPKPYSPKQEA